jgi:hypothetical protein
MAVGGAAGDGIAVEIGNAARVGGAASASGVIGAEASGRTSERTRLRSAGTYMLAPARRHTTNNRKSKRRIGTYTFVHN